MSEFEHLRSHIVVLEDRVRKLEFSQKITRWVFGGVGVVLGIVAREILQILIALLKEG